MSSTPPSKPRVNNHHCRGGNLRPGRLPSGAKNNACQLQGKPIMLVFSNGDATAGARGEAGCWHAAAWHVGRAVAVYRTASSLNYLFRLASCSSFAAPLGVGTLVLLPPCRLVMGCLAACMHRQGRKGDVTPTPIHKRHTTPWMHV